MMRRLFTLTALITGLALFGLSNLSLAGRCGPPAVLEYNPSTDSYIVIEGTISGLPANYVWAYPNFIEDPFPGKPVACNIIALRRDFQRPSRPYYCLYHIFKDTATKRECWEYFRNLSTINSIVNFISVSIIDRSGESVQNWTPQPSSRTVNLGPVQSR